MEEKPKTVIDEAEAGKSADREIESAAAELPKDKHPEHLGRVLVTSEAPDEDRRSRSAAETAMAMLSALGVKPETAPAETTATKRIETLGRTELMELGEKIFIDGSNLRQMYETHLIGERGMRRLAAEYARGGDLHGALRYEVSQREMDFERDPVLRDVVVPTTVPKNTSNKAIEKLLAKAAVNVEERGEEAAFYKARADYETTHQEQRHRRQRRVVDISLALVIIFLILLIIIMYAARR